MKITTVGDTDKARQLCGRKRDHTGHGMEAEENRETTNCREMQESRIVCQSAELIDL